MCRDCRIFLPMHSAPAHSRPCRIQPLLQGPRVVWDVLQVALQKLTCIRSPQSNQLEMMATSYVVMRRSCLEYTNLPSL